MLLIYGSETANILENLLPNPVLMHFDGCCWQSLYSLSLRWCSQTSKIWPLAPTLHTPMGSRWSFWAQPRPPRWASALACPRQTLCLACLNRSLIPVFLQVQWPGLWKKPEIILLRWNMPSAILIPICTLASFPRQVASPAAWNHGGMSQPGVPLLLHLTFKQQWQQQKEGTTLLAYGDS